MGAREKYENALAALAGEVGGRNARLLGVARLGRLAGVESSRLEEEIRGAAGSPPLTVAEVRRVVQRVERETPLGGDGRAEYRGARPYAVARPSPPPPGGFVARCLARGAGLGSSGALRSLSPVFVPSKDADEDRRTALRLFLGSLYDAGEVLFIGERSGREVRTRAEWEARLAETPPDAWPPLIGSNPFTGEEAQTADGTRRSFRCKAAVAARRFALVEFDGMPLDRQAAFWAGVILGTGRGPLLPLAALVYSGGKSIHALLRVDCADAEAWAAFWNRLGGFVCNPNDPAPERADAACRDESRMTRLPGARRADSGRVQSLLYLARPAEGEGAALAFDADLRMLGAPGLIRDALAALPPAFAWWTAAETRRIVSAESLAVRPADGAPLALARWGMVDALMRFDTDALREACGAFLEARETWEAAHGRALAPAGEDWPPIQSKPFEEVEQ